MERKTQREIVTALVRAGKRDLAERFVRTTRGCCREVKLDPRFVAWAAKAKKPKAVERYYKDCMASKTGKAKGESYCAAVAWSIYCKHKKPDSPHCKQAEYFTGKGAP
jgi:hypothetical protein